MTDKIKEAPVISFRCAPHILERMDALIESDKIKFVNRSVFIKKAIREYVNKQEKELGKVG